MINVIKSVGYLQLAAFLLVTAVAEPAPAASQRTLPLHGTMQSSDTVISIEFPTMVVESLGAGHATLLGHFTWELEVWADLELGTAFGNVILTAANGDTLLTEFTATSAPTDIPGTIRISEVHTITGGTGRFEGASGTFTREAVSDTDSGTTSGVLDGTALIDKTKY